MMSGRSIPGIPIPSQFADMSMQLLAPKRSIIVDMVMVQLLSAIVVFVGILLFKANEISQSEMTMMVVGVFLSLFLLSSVYHRITRF